MNDKELVKRLQTLAELPTLGKTDWKDAGQVLNKLIILRDGLISLTKEIKEG